MAVNKKTKKTIVLTTLILLSLSITCGIIYKLHADQKRKQNDVVAENAALEYTQELYVFINDRFKDHKNISQPQSDCSSGYYGFSKTITCETKFVITVPFSSIQDFEKLLTVKGYIAKHKANDSEGTLWYAHKNRDIYGPSRFTFQDGSRDTNVYTDDNINRSVEVQYSYSYKHIYDGWFYHRTEHQFANKEEIPSKDNLN